LVYLAVRSGRLELPVALRPRSSAWCVCLSTTSAFGARESNPASACFKGSPTDALSPSARGPIRTDSPDVLSVRGLPVALTRASRAAACLSPVAGLGAAAGEAIASGSRRPQYTIALVTQVRNACRRACVCLSCMLGWGHGNVRRRPSRNLSLL